MHRTGIAALVLLLSVPGLNYCAEKPAPEVLRDLYGDPLPPGALARMGSTRFKHSNGVIAAAFSPDGKTLATLGYYGTFALYLWELKTGRLIRRLELGQRKVFQRITFSTDGKTLALGASSGGLFLVDSQSGKELCHLDPSKYEFYIKLAFSPDGRLVAVCGKDAVQVLQVPTGKQERTLKEADLAPVTDAAFSADGKTLVSVDQRSCVRIWNVADGTVTRRFTLDPDLAKAANAWVRLSRDGSAAVILAADGFHVWDVATRKSAGHSKAREPLDVVHLQQRPGLGYYGKKAKAFVILDFAKGKTDCELKRVVDPSGFLFSPDGRFVVNVDRFGGDFQLWDATTGKILSEKPEHHVNARSVIFSPSGKMLATVGDDNTLRLWDAKTGEQLQCLEQSRGPGSTAAFTPDGRAIIARGDTKALRGWDVETGEVLSDYPEQVVGDVVASPDGRFLAVEGSSEDRKPDHAVRLLALASGKVVGTSRWPAQGYPGPFFLPGRVAFTWDSSILAVSDFDNGIRVLDVPTLKEIRRFRPGKVHDQRTINALGISPNGRLLAVCSCNSFALNNQGFGILRTPDPFHTDNAVHLLDMATGNVLLKLTDDEHIILGVAFSPDGRALATGSQDATIRMWEVATGKQLAQFSDGGTRVHHVAFSPDGDRLASAMNSGLAIVWDWKPLGLRLPAAKPADADVKRFWSDLRGGDAPAAHRAIYTLAAFPETVLPFLRENLKPVAVVMPDRLRRLIRELDREDFDRRAAAQKELALLGSQVEAELRNELAKTKSAEVRRAITVLLEDLPPTLAIQDPATLQAVRGVWVLQRIGTPEARKQLEALAAGVPANGSHVKRRMHSRGWIGGRGCRGKGEF